MTTATADTSIIEGKMSKRARESRPVEGVIAALESWEQEHSPYDAGSMLNLFRVAHSDNEKQQTALIPYSGEKDAPTLPPLLLKPHARDQLLARLEFPQKLYDRLPGGLIDLNLNHLILNGAQKDVLFRIQDDNRVRAMMSGKYETFDNLELLKLAAPFLQGGQVRWESVGELTLNMSIGFPNLRQEIRAGATVERGIHISNSEVGMRAVTVAGYCMVVQCLNGYISTKDSGMFYRFRHMGNQQLIGDKVRAAIESTMMASEGVVAKMQLALQEKIDKPAEYIEAFAKDGGLTRDQYERVLNQFVADPGDRSVFDVGQAISWVAGETDGEEAFDLERAAVNVLDYKVR